MIPASCEPFSSRMRNVSPNTPGPWATTGHGSPATPDWSVGLTLFFPDFCQKKAGAMRTPAYPNNLATPLLLPKSPTTLVPSLSRLRWLPLVKDELEKEIFKKISAPLHPRV